MSAYNQMRTALDEADEASAVRLLKENPELAQRRFLGQRQCGHSAPLLLHAAELQMAELVENLLALGVSPDTYGGGGATSLHYAASRGCERAVKALIEAGATVDVKCSFWGNTPLGWTAGSSGEGTFNCLKLLLEAGADPAITSTRGFTPLALADYHKAKDNIKYLESIDAPREMDMSNPIPVAAPDHAIPEGLIFHLAYRDNAVVDLCGREFEVEGEVSSATGRAGGTAVSLGNGCLRIPHDDAFNGKGGLTVAMWLKIRRNATDREHVVISKGKWERYACPWELAVNPDWSVSFHSFGNVENERCVFHCPRRGEWHHVVGVLGDEYHQIYIDGEEKIRVRLAGEMTDNEVPVTIGRRADDPDCYRLPFEGELEDVMIFDRALSAEELQIVMGTSSG